MKNGVDRVADAIKHGVDDTRDALNEARHRTEAEAERAKRDVAGESMTPGEKVGSALNEGKERVLAEVDKTKRETRDNT